jgi:hypothetical protein
VWVVIGQSSTDGSGSVTFWLNPDYDHKFTFEVSTCTYQQTTIRPTQSQYTQQIACGSATEEIVTQVDGIKYARSPAEGIIQIGVNNFTYQVVSSKANIINASFYLINSSSGIVLNSTSSSCNPGGCHIWFLYNVTSGADLKGKYYLDVGNGSVLLEGDAHWVNVAIPTEGKAGITTFLKDLRILLNSWGTNTNTADFNRLVVIFVLLAIIISFANLQLGNVDSSNPGALLLFMTTVVLLSSMVGGISGQGLFYYNNLSSYTFLNNYILAAFCIIISGSYFINVNRNASR